MNVDSEMMSPEIISNIPKGTVKTIKKLYQCTHESCRMEFDRPYKLKQHIQLHNNIRSWKCPEESCIKAYSSKSHLDRHIKNTHKTSETPENIVISCPMCENKYANRQNLKRHIKQTHFSKKLFCDVCKKSFIKKNQLNAHMYEHTRVKSFGYVDIDSRCHICSKEFVTITEKKRHMRNHKTYKCDDCFMVFQLWSKYQKHRKTEHKIKEYVCDYCERTFKERIHIVRHIKLHNYSEKVHLCPYEDCGRLYTRNSNLRHHILIKHEKVTHECTVCHSQLATKATLRKHMNIHDKTAQVVKKPQKTLSTGRKERKDKGEARFSTAMKIAGFPLSECAVDVIPTDLVEVCL